MKNTQNIKPIYIAFGANLSNPKSTFVAAIDALASHAVTVTRMSSLWQSPAWPAGGGQPDYINACGEVEFSGGARELLTILHSVETKMGRVRSAKNAARTLDLDLLDFRGQVIAPNPAKPDSIAIPHPRMLSRGFVLFPLSEIAPDWRDPTGSIAIIDHIARLPLADVAPMERAGRFSPSVFKP